MRLIDRLRIKGLVGSGVSSEYLSGTGVFSTPAGGGSADNLLKNRIYGLEPTYTSATALGATAGCAWSEGDAASFYRATALSDLTGLTGTAGHYGHLYSYNNAGTVIIDTPVDGGVAGSTNPPILFANPAGNARSKSGATTRRFIGSVLWGATNTIRPFQTRDLGGGRCEYIYLADAGAAAPFKVSGYSAGSTPTTYTALDASALIPNNGCAVEMLLSVELIVGTSPAPSFYLSLDGTGYMGIVENPADTAARAIAYPCWVPINATTTTALYFKSATATAAVSFYCWAYRYRR